MDEGWERKKSWSRSISKDKKDKEKKKKKKHHDEKDRSRSHHKKKKKHSSPQKLERIEKEKSRQADNKQDVSKHPEKEVEGSPMKDAHSKSEKKKKRKDSKDSEHKKKKKKQKKEKRDRSYDSRSRSRQKKKKRDYRDDRDYRSRRDGRDEHRRDRRKRSYDRRDNFRYDSPPKASNSQAKEDPQQIEKLSQLKAAKQLVSSKADRKLYLGNLPPNITSQQLMEMLNSALKKMDINTDVEGDSIVSAWISPDGVGHYAFVEFRTAQQATNGLTLNGASLFGYQLKLGRPKQYIEYNKALLSDMGTDKNMETIIKKVATLGKNQLPLVQQKIIAPPSKIVVLKHIVSIQQLGIDEEYNQIYEDVQEMAKRFGEVVSIIIPRPHEIIDLESAPTRVKGLGLIFIQYKTVSDAKSARTSFVSKEFSGRPVACSFFDEKKFRSAEYDIQDKVIIDF